MKSLLVKTTQKVALNHSLKGAFLLPVTGTSEASARELSKNNRGIKMQLSFYLCKDPICSVVTFGPQI